MQKMDIALGMIFRDLGVASKESLSDRVIIQKKIYLLQELGVDLGYSFNWYLKGPYSPRLTEYVYDKLELLTDTSFEEYTLNQRVIGIIEKINGLADEKNDAENLSESQWYELLASLKYLNKNHSFYKKSKPKQEDVIKKLIEEKPQYTNKQCESAWALMKEKELVV